MDHRFITEHPHLGIDPVARLRHTVDLFGNRPDDEFAIMATSGMYGKDERTGLTWGDLRAIADRLDAR